MLEFKLGCYNHPGVVELKPRTHFFGLPQSLASSGRNTFNHQDRLGAAKHQE